MADTLSGKVAIVTGSSTGIGAAIVRELSSRGAHTVITYESPAQKAAADVLATSLPTPATAVLADMSQIEAPKQLVEVALANWKRIDILVNCVGVAVNKPFEEQTLEDWDLLVNLNGRGTFLMTQAVLPHLTKNTGRIINIASTIDAGTKGMIESFTKCWARELPPKYGCTVNSVSPGPPRTGSFAAAGEEQMKILQPIIDQTPVGARMVEPDEIAYAVAFLAEERARWMNGVHLVASGGLFID
ncbi:hypothetical protein BJY01DRAFT_238555 [Aspergillus pseudoustus]|uniref:Short chain type dehydrogenase n=1 Tax=Aspergillus pseudoustus TaxID=1810923 RepID=A0ABR4J8B0_9EURO